MALASGQRAGVAQRAAAAARRALFGRRQGRSSRGRYGRNVHRFYPLVLILLCGGGEVECGCPGCFEMVAGTINGRVVRCQAAN